MIETGIILIKEDAVMCLSTVGEATTNNFKQYYFETVKKLMEYLSWEAYLAEQYNQFRAQIIETIILLSHAVGVEYFKPIGNDIVNLMI